MRTRSLVATLAALGLIVAPAAGAATKAKPKPKPHVYCNLLTDDHNDGTWLVPGVKSGGLDIQSGDLATGAKTMVAVLRLGSTDFKTADDPWSTLSYSWSFAATSTLGQAYAFTASLGFTGNLTYGASADGHGVPVQFKIVGNTFQWTIQRKDAPDLARPKNIFREFRASSAVLSSTADKVAPVPLTDIYPDRGLSCVHAA